MKSKSITAFLVLSIVGSSVVCSQEITSNVMREGRQNQESSWFMESSQWYYEIADDGMGSGVGCIHMSVSGDTVLDGKKCRRLMIESCDGSYETVYEYVYSAGEKLLYYNVAAEDFFLLLDLSAKPGDTVWVHTKAFVPNPGFDPYQRWKRYDTDSFSFMAYQITAVDTVNMGDKSLKRQSACPITVRNTEYGEEHSEWMFPGWHQDYIIEGIGSLGGFFGEVWGLYPEWGKCRLRCFSAEGKTFLSDGNCGETANETDKETFGLRIYPNPVGEVLHVAGEYRTLFITDLIGKRIGKEWQNVESVDMTGLPGGFYLLHITLTDGRKQVLKVMKR